jgi:uncharacterized membrane protein YoaK (UPF0700 family)
MANASSAVAAKRAPDSLPKLLLAMTVTTGLIDAISVLGLGNVFVALMTGNVLFLGFALAGAPGFDFARNATALSAFLLGAVLAGGMARMVGAATRRRWLLVTAAVESLLLLSASFLAGGHGMARSPATTEYSLIVLTAIAMGLRSGTVRKLGAADLPTTVLTLTLAGFASDAAAGQYKGAGRRLASVASMFVGAMTGALLVRRAGVAEALLAATAVLVAATLAYACQPSSMLPLNPVQPQRA